MSAYIEIENRSRTEYGECDYTDDWDRPDSWQYNDIRGFKVSEKGYRDLTVGYEPNFDDEYYLLYAEYKSGDTFGNDHGLIVYIEMYEKRSDAYANKEILENFKSEDYDFNVTIKDNSGQDMNFYVPWIGYFERLEALEVLEVQRLK